MCLCVFVRVYVRVWLRARLCARVLVCVPLLMFNDVDGKLSTQLLNIGGCHGTGARGLSMRALYFLSLMCV